MVFSPTDYAGLLGWWKADAITPVPDGTALAQWDDSSGRANHIAQATGGKQPLYKVAANGINGLPVVRFDGTDDCLTLSLDLSARTAVTVYIVVKPANTTQTGMIVEHTASGSANTGGWGCVMEPVQGFESYGMVGSHVTTTVSTFYNWATPTTNATIVSYRFGRMLRKHQCAVFVNGDGLGSPSVDAQNANSRYLANSTLNIGSRNNGASLPFNGDVAEILLYGQLHTPDQRIAVEGYLADKYAITVVESDGSAVFSGHSDVDGDAPSTKIRLWWRRALLNVTERIDWLCTGRNGSTSEKFEGQRYPRAWWVENDLTTRILSSHSPNNDLIQGFSVAKTEFNTERDWLDALGTNATHVDMATIKDRNEGGLIASFDADKATVSAWMRANIPAAIQLFDFEQDANLGPTGVSDAGTGFFASDTVHLSDPRGEAYIGRLYTDYLVDDVGLTRWTPALLSSGMVLWLDASQESFANDDLVATWTDRSAAGNHATAAGTARPTFKTNILCPNNAGTGTLPVMRFDGSTDGMVTPAINLTGTSAVTIMLVASAGAGVGANKIFVEASPDESAVQTAFVLFRNTSSKMISGVRGNVGFNQATSVANLTTTAGLVASILDKSAAAAGEARQRLNGTEATAGASNNTNAFGNHALYIGARNQASLFLDGDIAEILIWNRALTLAEFRRAESYLGTKYGVY